MEHLLLTHRDITSLSLNNPDIELVVQPGAWQPPTFQLDRITNCLRVLSTPAAGGVMRHPNLQSLYLNLCGSYPSSLEALSAIKESLQAVRAIHPTIRILAMYSDHSVRDEFPEISFMEVHELHDAALEDWELPWTHYELKCMGRMWV
ncbi:hypothetical protein DL93DRAFT_2074060 [Clavulina sp. PMI_390]|nr:hypothetical protein DL93DRAFT_2074060 [Clavulina sp. PMI_390]